MKIMIIDDEPDVLDYLKAVLEDNGFDTCTIEENEPVDEAIQSYSPDLIILDIMMPRRSGVSIYKELRSTPEFKTIPIAIISGMMPEKDFKKSFQNLVNDNTISLPDGFIEKPIQLKELLELIQKLLN